MPFTEAQMQGVRCPCGWPQPTLTLITCKCCGVKEELPTQKLSPLQVFYFPESLMYSY